MLTKRPGGARYFEPILLLLYITPKLPSIDDGATGLVISKLHGDNVKLIINGSIAFDYLMSFPGSFYEHLIADKLDKISVSFLVDALNRRHGGCAANIAYSLALLGESPLLVGSVGRDFGEYEQKLASTGVDCSHIHHVEDVFTASFFCNTDRENNQISSFYTGAMQYARDISLEPFKDEKTLAIISPDDPEAMSRHARECREFGIPFIYDPSQQIVRLEGSTLRQDAEGAKVLIFNEYELEMFRKKTGLSDPRIFELAETVILTLGDDGAEIRNREGTLRIPCVPPQHIQDPTGVGDAFRSGIMKGMVSGLSWETTGRIAALAATYVLETDGPQNHHYDLDSFLRRYEAVFGPSPDLDRLQQSGYRTVEE